MKKSLRGRPQSEAALKFLQSILSDEYDDFEIGYLSNPTANPAQLQTLQEAKQTLQAQLTAAQTKVQTLTTDKTNLEASILAL